MAKKVIVHVNQHHIRHNTKQGTDEPVLTVKSYNTNEYCHELILVHPDSGEELGRFVYQPHDPLSCGARVWFETTDSKLNLIPIIRKTNGQENYHASVV